MRRQCYLRRRPDEASGTRVLRRPQRRKKPSLLFHIMVDSVAATLDAIVSDWGHIIQPTGAVRPRSAIDEKGRQRFLLVCEDTRCIHSLRDVARPPSHRRIARSLEWEQCNCAGFWQIGSVLPSSRPPACTLCGLPSFPASKRVSAQRVRRSRWP